MKTALAGLGYKTHFVSNQYAHRTYVKTLCGRQAYAMFDGEGLATGSDGYCEKCETIKDSMEKRLTLTK